MNLLIRNVPSALYERLSVRARHSRRTPDDEALVLLEQVLGGRPSVAEELAAIDAQRNSLRVTPLTPEFLDAAINDRRP
jgi:plasmid stability protein